MQEKQHKSISTCGGGDCLEKEQHNWYFKKVLTLSGVYFQSVTQGGPLLHSLHYEINLNYVISLCILATVIFLSMLWKCSTEGLAA